MRSFLRKTVLFGFLVLAFCAVIRTAAPYYAARPQLLAKMLRWQKEKDRYNAYFLGTSRTFRGVNPTSFDEIVGNGMKSFNLGIRDAFGIAQIRFTEYFLNAVPPGSADVVFWEVTPVGPISEDLAGIPERNYFVNIPVLRLAAEHFFELGDLGQIRLYSLEWLFNQLKVGQMYRIAAVAAGADQGELSALGPQGNGFLPLTDERFGRARSRRTVLEYPALLDDRRQAVARSYAEREPVGFSEAYLAKIHELVRLAESKGVSVVFVLFPRDQNCQALFDRIDSKLKVDLCDPRVYPQLYSYETTFDVSHLNGQGAEVLTRLLASKYIELIGETSVPARAP